MNKQFKLTLHWILKFATIDRLKRGELGVKPEKVPSIISDEEKIAIENDIIKSIMQLNENETCKRKRVDVLKNVGIGMYQKYLSNWKKCRFVEEKGVIFVKMLGQKSIEIQEFFDAASLNVRWVNNRYSVLKNGYLYFRNISSFDELYSITTNLF